MPVYEYECPSCKGRFEAIQRFSDPVLTECRLCSAAGIRKVLSAPAFVLKGSGWYVTDYPSEARKQGMEKERAPAAAAETAGPKKDAAPKGKKAESPGAPPAGAAKKPAKHPKKRA